MDQATAAAPAPSPAEVAAKKKEDEKKLEEAKQAKIAKLRRLLVLVGVLGFLAGVASLFFYPEYLASKTYVSENALSPHWDTFRYGREDVQFVSTFTKQYQEFQKTLSHEIRSQDEAWNNVTALWLVSKLRQLGIDANVHSFAAPNRTPLRATPMHLRGVNRQAWNVQAVLRAPRSPGGQDATLLTARFARSGSGASNSASSLGFVISMMKSLEKLKWRSRDVVMILSADIYDGAGLAAWLNDHFTLGSAFKGATEGGVQQHYATIFGALNFDVTATSFRSIGIRAEGSYGNLPNLDLINTITRVSSRVASDGRQVDLSLSESIFPKNIEISALQLDLGRPVDVIPNFVENEQLFTMMSNLASGVPNGDHAYMSRYSINSVTLYTSSGSSGYNSGSAATLIDLGRTVEGTLRSLHNLVEPLHQSFYFYLLPSPMTYVSIGHYMITLGLLVAGFTLHPTLVLLVGELSDAVYSLVHVVIAFGLGIAAFAAPMFSVPAVEVLGISYEIQALGMNENLAPVVWILVAVFGDIFVRVVIFPLLDGITSVNSDNQNKDSSKAVRQESLAAAAVLPIFVALPIIALFNFSFAVLAAIPSIVIATVFVRAASAKMPIRLLQSALLLATSPVALLYYGSILLEMSFAEAIELMITNYVQHNSLLFPYLCLVWLPVVTVGQKRLLGI